MAAGNSFDQWQKDVFFSAAEEVQESADVMESMYRMWMRERSDGSGANVSDELRRELHTALGTAKWQLEEFERAVNWSHENYSSGKNTITRHKQFVAAIGNQICHVEKALRDSLIEEGKQPLRWVQLDKEERDDLAVFLSAPLRTLHEAKDNRQLEHESTMGFKETLTINKDATYVLEVEAKEPIKGKEVALVQREMLGGQSRTSTSPDVGSWKIVIADEEDVDRKTVEARAEVHSRPSSISGFLRNVESAARSKWFRNSFPKVKNTDCHHSNQDRISLKGVSRFAQQGMNGLTDRNRSCLSNFTTDSKVSNVQQLAGRVGGLRRHIQSSEYFMQSGRSVRATLLLLLSIFLIVPIFIYST